MDMLLKYIGLFCHLYCLSTVSLIFGRSLLFIFGRKFRILDLTDRNLIINNSLDYKTWHLDWIFGIWIVATFSWDNQLVPRDLRLRELK